MSSTARFSFGQWISQYTQQHPHRTKSLVMSLFCDAITPHGGHVWMGSLIELLSPFGINERLVRTSAFRLAEEGWLDAQRDGRRSLYMVNDKSAGRLELAYQRVYASSYKKWDEQWTLLFTMNNAITAHQRALLRKELTWQGFAMIDATVFIHPASDTATLKDIIERLGIADAIFIAKAMFSDLPFSLPLNTLVSQCWALDDVINSYRHFITSFSPVLAALSDDAIEPNAQEAFLIRILVIHHFRRIQLHDPQLPLALLPSDWPGKIAYELCRDIYKLTFEAAEKYIVDTLRHEDNTISDSPAPYFYHRFGGLSRDQQLTTSVYK